MICKLILEAILHKGAINEYYKVEISRRFENDNTCTVITYCWCSENKGNIGRVYIN